MTEQTIGVGVVGMGGIGAVHSVLMNALPGATLRAVADSDNRLTRMAGRILPALDFVTDFTELLDRTDISLLVVCTPPLTHEVILRSALAKSHLSGILIEKPLAPDALSTQRMAGLARRDSVVTAVGFQKRFNPIFKRVKSLLDSHVLGEVAYFRASSFSRGTLRPATGWRGEHGAGGVLLDWGIHAIDLACWFLGPLRVKSAERVAHFSSHVEDYAAALVESDAGVAGVIEVGWSARNYLPPGISVELHGSNGMLRCTEHELSVWTDRRSLDGSDVVVNVERKLAHDLNQRVPFLYGPVEVILQDEAIIKACKSGNWAGANFVDSCSVSRIVDSIRAEPLVAAPGPRR